MQVSFTFNERALEDAPITGNQVKDRKMQHDTHVQLWRLWMWGVLRVPKQTKEIKPRPFIVNTKNGFFSGRTYHKA